MATSRIEMNPKVMMGKPVIRGTRIPVELILRKLGEGGSEAELLEAYPRLTKADIQAAIGYAADTVAHEETVLVDVPFRKRSKR
ncbi:MAG: antitoxin [Nitrospira sp. WS110]|nr:antitoxin [Nitrospira sp. WS110]